MGPTGLWMIGAFGGVASTVSLGLAALQERRIEAISLTTALPLFAGLDLPGYDEFVVGGHDIRRGSFLEAAMALHTGANVFDARLLEACAPRLEAWSANVRPGTALNAGAAINRLVELPQANKPESARAAVERIKADLVDFRTRQRLRDLVVVHVASTEPPFGVTEAHQSVEQLQAGLAGADSRLLPASALYALAAVELGLAYVNFTPSLGASFAALEELALTHGSVLAGQDGKTGETLLKTVLAPMFAARNWRVLSWVGHNIFGNRDGLVLDEPENKSSKLRTKDQVTSGILGYKPQTHVSIEYIPSLDDWKTAWDHIHFQGFLGVKMMLQFTWQGCDSILAAPLVIDLARLALFAQRRGESGVLGHLACYFKNPRGVDDHDFFHQLRLLEEYVGRVRGTVAG